MSGGESGTRTTWRRQRCLNDHVGGSSAGDGGLNKGGQEDGNQGRQGGSGDGNLVRCPYVKNLK